MLHSPRRIVTNTFIYTGTLVIQKIIAFSYFWFLSSRLQPELLGTYIWALSLTTLFSVGVDLGLSPLLIREAARDNDRVERLLRSVLGLKILFGLGTLILLGLILGVSGRNFTTVLVVMIAVLVMVFDSFAMSFWSVTRARQIVIYESVGMLTFHVLVFALGAYLLNIFRSPVFAMMALAVGSFTMFLFSMIIVRTKFKLRVSPIFEKESFQFLLKLLPAFALAGVFVRIYNAADSILLGYLADNTAVGLYSVPAKVVTALQMLLPGAFIASIYPAMSHYYKNSRADLERLFERSIGYLTVLSLPITIGLLVLASRILETVWPEYISIQATFVLMILGLPFLFATFPTGYLLNASDRQRKNTINRGIITVINIVLNLLLIPFFGVFGAGVAFLTANVILFFLDLRNVRQVIPFAWGWLLKIFIKAGIGSMVMGGMLLVLVEHLSLPTLVLLGMVLYAIILFALRIFSREEIKMVRELFQKKPVSELPPQI